MHNNRLMRIFALFPLVTLLVSACSGGSAATPGASSGAAQGGQDFKGTTIRLVGANHPWMDAIKPLLPEFETKTGIKVAAEAYGEDQLTQKLTTEFTAGGSDIDVIMQRPLQEARVMKKNGWYEDLTKYAQDPAYDFKDFQSGAVDTETVDKFLTGIPIVTEQEILYYRKDLLEAAGLKVPTTIDELMAAAAKLTDKSKGMYGFVARGQRSPLITQFSSYLYSFGGDWNDKSGKATFDSPEALKAIDTYGTLLRQYGPPGVLNMSWPQAVAVFAQGKVALYTDASAIFNNVLDPKYSQVAGKTGVAKFPSGPSGSVPYSICSWGLAMYSGSQKKGAAWEFIKWATSKEVALKTMEAKVPGARQSVWDDPKGTANFPKDWVTAVQASAKGRAYDRPLVTEVGQARDILGQAVVTAIEGGDYKAAAQRANQDYQTLLDSEK